MTKTGRNQKEEILSTAAELFMQKGYHATSVREIGDRAGVSQSSLYYHAKSKGQILVDLNHRFMANLVGAIEDIADRDASPADQVRAIVDILINTAVEHQADVTVVLRERRSLPARQGKTIQRLRDRVDQLIDGILTDGITEGIFRDVDVVVTRLALTGMCNWAYEWWNPNGRLTPREIAAQFTEIFLRGVSR
jgi:AcrR family transcriptional regulator